MPCKTLNSHVIFAARTKNSEPPLAGLKTLKVGNTGMDIAYSAIQVGGARED
jgi:hypothetical protein